MIMVMMAMEPTWVAMEKSMVMEMVVTGVMVLGGDHGDGHDGSGW